MANIQAAKQPWEVNMSALLGLVGATLIMISFLIGLFILTPTASDYFGNNAKIHRDCAGVDSSVTTAFDGPKALAARCATEDSAGDGGTALQDQLVTLTSTNRWKEPLAFVGVASFMAGIALAFSSIPALLKNRGDVMAAAYKQILAQGA
ncbi:MAG: hypothetical protein Q9P44_03925 [Anaerolineae bacterium]|nr:hypothetical protein [Anaerolineae bacterium]